MIEPLWITEEVVLATQDSLIERFGGLGGIRDQSLPDSALDRPKHLCAYGELTLFELAASYALGIVKNHPFLDGNKRAGFMAAYIFLGANGQLLDVAEEEVVERTLALAAGAINEADYARWLQDSCVSE